MTINGFTKWFIFTAICFPVWTQAKPWGQSYAEAMRRLPANASEACQSLLKLSEDRQSPIAALALARHDLNCLGKTPAAAIQRLSSLHAQNPWLQPLTAEAIVELARKSKNLRALVDYAEAHLPNLSSQREKEKLLKEASSAAKTLGLNADYDRLLSRLHALAPRLEANPPPQRWLKVAEDFQSNQDWNTAVQFYDRVLNTNSFSTQEKFKALYGIREARKSQFRFARGDLKVFLTASQRVAEFVLEHLDDPALDLPQKRVMFEALVQRARDHWSYDDVEVAKKQISNILKLNLAKPFRAYTLWMLARIHANTKNWAASAEVGKQATRQLQEEVANAGVWGPWFWTLWDDSFWTTAFSLRKAGRLAESADLLELSLSHTSNLNASSKFRFWLARNRTDLKLDARKDWQALINEDRHGYYGFLAHHELGVPISPLARIDKNPPRRPAALSDYEFQVLIQLVEADERPLAQKFLNKKISPSSLNEDELILRAHIHDYQALMNLFFTAVPASERNAFLDRYASLLFPKPFVDITRKARERIPRVEEDYVYSIMRQESSFNPLSLSWANAYGLLQVLPNVARASQKKAGVTFTHDYELFRPEINIPIGIAHMDDLFMRVGNSFVMRTASYNATVSKARDWKQRLYKGNIHEWIEEIPYDETRSYIRLVTRNYLMNRRLSAREAFSFPTGLLSM